MNSRIPPTGEEITQEIQGRGTGPPLTTPSTLGGEGATACPKPILLYCDASVMDGARLSTAAEVVVLLIPEHRKVLSM